MSRQTSTVKLNTIADVLQGQSPESKYYSDSEGTPFLQGNRSFGNLYPSFDTYTKKVTKLARKGDVLISVRAPVGALNLAPCDLCIGRGLASIKAKNGDNKFVYYALRYNVANLVKQGGATTFDSVNKETIENFDLVIPNDEIDKKNSALLLSSLDQKIQLNNKINAELEAMTKLTYDYWFVQFDFPNANGKPYKSSGGKMAWCEELKREIPEGWSVKNISNCLTTSLGGTPSTKIKEYWENGDIPWLSSEEVSDFPILSSNKKISQTGLENSAASLLPEGSVVISIVRYIRTSILGMQATANQSVVGILESDLLKKSYIYPFFISKTPKLMSLRTGAQQPHINKNVIDTTQILVPDEKVLRDYYEHVDSMYEYIIENARATKKLTELRDWLLPMLMNGQVKIV